MKARVLVYPRREILDPQGKAIRQALGGIGFEEVEMVRAGKMFEIDLQVDDLEEARARLNEMCEKLLANPIIEDYSYEIVETDS